MWGLCGVLVWGLFVATPGCSGVVVAPHVHHSVKAPRGRIILRADALDEDSGLKGSAGRNGTSGKCGVRMSRTANLAWVCAPPVLGSDGAATGLSVSNGPSRIAAMVMESMVIA